MATHSMSIGAIREQARESWVPMIAIALGQMIMSFNVASLPVALGGMVKSFGVPPTTVATGIVAYSMLVAGFVMLGAKLVAAVRRAAGVPLRRRPVLRIADIDDLQPHGNVDDHGTGALRRGRRRHRAGAGGADRRELHAGGSRRRPSARSARRGRRPACWRSSSAACWAPIIGWRPAFGILIAVSAIVFLLSFRLKRDYGRPDVQIDVLGVVLAASAIILISFGFNNLNGWGVASGHGQCAVRPARPVAGADHDRSRRRARAGLPDVDAPAPGGRKDAAAGARGDRLAAGAQLRSTRCLPWSRWRRR